MIETLILGFLIGTVCTSIGAAYAAYKFIKQPFVCKELTDGNKVYVFDKTFGNDKYNMLAVKSGDKYIATLKFDKDSIKDIYCDI